MTTCRDSRSLGVPVLLLAMTIAAFAQIDPPTVPQSQKQSSTVDMNRSLVGFWQSDWQAANQASVTQLAAVMTFDSDGTVVRAFWFKNPGEGAILMTVPEYQGDSMTYRLLSNSDDTYTPSIYSKKDDNGANPPLPLEEFTVARVSMDEIRLTKLQGGGVGRDKTSVSYRRVKLTSDRSDVAK